jgi:alkylation response protein AidB-like acyl-CoA dehydrogenase
MLDDDDVRAIVEAVRKFAESELEPNALQWDQDKHFPVDSLRRAGELGLGGICAGEDVGGAGLDRSVSVRIFEALSRGDTAVAAYISIHNMVVGMIDRFGTLKQREEWVTPMVTMDRLGSYCLTEPDAGSDAAAINTRATPDGDDFILNGVKQFISGAGATDVYLVMARTSDDGARGITCFIVPADTPGLSFGPNERKMGWHAQPTRQVVVENLRVPRTAILGELGEGFRIAMTALNGGRLNIAACSLGGADWALDKAISHLRDRTAFGAPLINQQALQFELAAMATRLEAGRRLLYHAAAALDEGAPDAVKLCAMAKSFVTDASFTAANSALQMHGGYGYLAEYGIEKVVRDLRVHQILEGTNQIMQLIIGRALSEGVA